MYCSKDSDCDSGLVCVNVKFTNHGTEETEEYDICISRSFCGTTDEYDIYRITYSCGPNLGLIFGVGGGVLALLLIIFVVVRIIKKKQ